MNDRNGALKGQQKIKVQRREKKRKGLQQEEKLCKMKRNRNKKK